MKIRNKFYIDMSFRELISGSAIAFFMQCAGMIFGYVLIAQIANYFGARILGIYSLTYTTLMIFTMLSTLGLDMVILKMVGKDDINSSYIILKKIYSVVIPSSLFFSLILVSSAILYSDFIFNEVEYKKYFISIGISLTFSAILSINIEYLRAKNRIALSEFMRNVLRPFIISILMAISYFFPLDEYFPSYILLISCFISCIVSFILILFKTFDKDKPILEFQYEESKGSLIRIGLPMQYSMLAFYIICNAAVYFVEAFENSFMVGLVSVSIKLAGLVNMPLMVINKVCAPRISKLFSNNQYAELQKYLYQISTLSFYLALIVCIVLATFSDIFLLIFGNEFLQAKIFLLILLGGQFISCASGPVGIFMMMTGNERVYRNITVIIAFISLLAYCFIVPKYGVFGAVCVLSLSQALLNAISAVYIKFGLGFVTIYHPFKNRTFF